jgi:hypothetical protein
LIVVVLAAFVRAALPLTTPTRRTDAAAAAAAMSVRLVASSFG